MLKKHVSSKEFEKIARIIRDFRIYSDVFISAK